MLILSLVHSLLGMSVLMIGEESKKAAFDRVLKLNLSLLV